MRKVYKISQLNKNKIVMEDQKDKIYLKNTKMAGASPPLLEIILNVNGLNSPL